VYLLANNPDIQQRLYAEISKVQHLNATAAAATDPSQFKYLNCVIKEALR